MSDDLSTLQYRTKGGQKAPLIISTRGHRLEGIWHSGSPMGMIINALRGMNICVPRNMTKAAGFYNILLESDEPALVVEPLNGYRTKEKFPKNIGEFNEPLGIPEIVKEGKDITLVSYGSTFNLCVIAEKSLEQLGISVELIDVQTLIPFDTNHIIKKSIEKTNRLNIVDEDVSSGATAYILDKIMVVVVAGPSLIWECVEGPKRHLNQGAAKGVRQKEFDHFFRFRDAFGHFSVTFSDAFVTFFVTFFARLLLPDSFCGRVRIWGNFQSIFRKKFCN